MLPHLNPQLAPNLLAVPVCTWLATRYGKKLVLYIVAFSGLLGNLSIFVFYTPENPWLQLIPPLLIGPVSVGLWLIVPAMQADVADYDELHTGARREGSFSAVFSWTTKVSGTLTSGIGGLILVWTGFNIDFGVEQPEHVLTDLRNYYALIPIGFILINLALVYNYQLSRERMAEIRAKLEARRGAL